MIRRAGLALLAAAALAAPGCFVTRPLGLGPDPDPGEVAKGDSPEVIFEKAQRLFADQQWKEAADAFNQVWTEFPKTRFAEDAQFYEADSRFGQMKYNGAFELYKRFIKDWPLSPHCPLVQRRIFDLGVYTIEAGQHGVLDLFDYAHEGVEQLDYLVSAFPHGDLADDALIYMADYEYRANQPNEAIAHLHDLIDNYAGSPWALEGRLRLAKAYRVLNRGTRYDADALLRAAAEYRAYIDLVVADRDRAREYAEQLAQARSELAEVEETLATKRLESAAYYLRRGNPAASRTELLNVVRDFPNSRAADDARRQLGVETPAKVGGDK